MESRIVHLRKSLEEKDSTINDLTNKMKVLEDKLEDISIDEELESKLKNQETKLKTISSTLSKLEKIAKSKEGKLECSDCDYITSSEKLMKTHVNIKYEDQKKIQISKSI